MSVGRLVLVILALVLLAAPLLADQSSANTVLSPGQELYVKHLYSGVLSIDWSSDGQYIAVLLASPKLVIFHSNGSLVGSYNVPHGSRQVAWRPGHDLVAVATGSSVLVYNVSGAVVYQAVLKPKILSIAWSLDGSRLAAGTDNGTLYMIDFRLKRRCECSIPGMIITSLAFTHDRKLLLVGGYNGLVRVYNLKTQQVLSSIRLGTKTIESIAVSPLDDRVAIMTGDATYLGVFNGTGISIYAREPFGGDGNVEWSPDGSVVFVPAGDRGVVIASNGTVIDYIAPPENYTIHYAAWNPAEYSRLALAGPNTVYSAKGIMIVVYSGALVTITSSPPVKEACWGGLCGKHLTISPDEQNTTIKLRVEAYTLNGSKTIAPIDLHLHLKPFQRLVLDTSKIPALSEAELRAENGKAVVIVFRSQQASLHLKYKGSWIKVPGLAVLVEPGSYEVSVALPRPDDYLGPNWVLARNQTLRLSAGEAVLLNYTWFRLSTVTARLHVSSEPNATIRVVFPNSTASTTLRSGEEEFTIPAGKYEIQLELSGEKALVPNRDVLLYSEELAVYPGDKIAVSFHYSDVAGILQVRALPGSRVVIIPPWSTDLNPVKYNFTMETSQEAFWAYPGNYKVMITPAKPSNFLGPSPPTGIANVTVSKGEIATVDAYSMAKLASYLQLVDSSANVTILANQGYMIVISAGNETYHFNVTENITLLLPPGTYKIDLVKPGKNLIIIKSRQLKVTGPGKITVNLLVKPGKRTSSKPVAPTYTPLQENAGKKRLYGAGIIIAVIIIAIALILKRRRGEEEIIL